MFNLSLTPNQLQTIISPGATYIKTFDIKNFDTNPITIIASIQAWEPSGNDGSLTYLSEEITKSSPFTFSLANAAVKLNQPFTIPGSGTQQLVLKIAPAATFQGDGYFTLFLTQSTANTVSSLSQSAAAGKMGVHLLLSSTATELKGQSATISQFRTSPFFKDSFFSPIQFTGLINNQSDYLFKTAGIITITKNDQVVSQLPLSPDLVLAHHDRQLRCLSADTTHNQICTLASPIWPGIYQATLQFDTTISVPKTTVTFFVFPYYLALSIIILATAFFAGWKIKFAIKKNKPPVSV